jgi:predicted transcriptional regulator
MTKLDLKNKLLEFGISGNEVEIYLSLLKSGPSSVFQISRRLSLNRSTVHSYVLRLIELGLVQKLIVDKSKRYGALSPESISQIIDRQILDLNKKKESLPSIIDSMYQFSSFIKDSSVSEVKYYKDRDSVSWLYQRILQEDELRTYVNANEIIKIFPENLARFSDAVKRGLKLWDLHLYSSYIDPEFLRLTKTYVNAQVKRFPPSVTFDPMDVLLYNGKVSIIFGLPNIHAIEISNLQYYNMSKALYDLIWGIL